MHLIATSHDGAIGMVQGFNAFCHCGHLELAGKPGHRVHDSAAFVLVGAFEVSNEGAINLDLVEGKAAQVAQRCISGAEVIKSNADAKAA